MNIAIILLDSYRADRILNEDKQISPFLKKFKSKTVLFKKAYTTAPWTLPSHATLFTGLYASEHGLQSGASGENILLDSQIKTLAELLKEKGFETAGFSSNPWVGKSSHLNRGFNFFVEYDFEVTRGNPRYGLLAWLDRFHKVIRRISGNRLPIIRRPYLTKTMIDTAIKWIRHTKEQKWFAFINLMDAHNPYRPPKLFVERVGGNSKKLLPVRKFNRMLSEYISGNRAASDLLKENIEIYYDASLAHVDFQVERFVSFLKREALLDDTLLFVLSDHGKTLGEYDRKQFPLHYITDLNTHIPLMVYDSADSPKEVESTVSLIDVYYTILYRVGFSANPNYNLRRKSLADRMKSHERSYVFSEMVLPFVGEQTSVSDRVRAITDGEHKLVISERDGEILFDKIRDSQEMKNFSACEPEIVTHLKEKLLEWEATLVSSPGSDEIFGVEDMEKDIQDHLKSLGYM